MKTTRQYIFTKNEKGLFLNRQLLIARGRKLAVKRFLQRNKLERKDVCIIDAEPCMA